MCIKAVEKHFYLQPSVISLKNKKCVTSQLGWNQFYCGVSLIVLRHKQICNEAVGINSIAFLYVPDCFRMQEMCNKPVSTMPHFFAISLTSLKHKTGVKKLLKNTKAYVLIFLGWDQCVLKDRLISILSIRPSKNVVKNI